MRHAVKLDPYEYEFQDIFRDDKYFMTVVYITIDSVSDVTVYDIASELSKNKRVHLNGIFYKALNYQVVDHDPVVGGPRFRLELVKERARLRR